MGRNLGKSFLCGWMLLFASITLYQTAVYQTAYAAEYDSNVVASVQDALNNAGYECGTADGVAGSKTREAIQQYQEANSLTASGEIDEELLVSLGIMTGSDEAVDADEPDEPVVEITEDSESESLLHLENSYGTYDLLGFDFDDSDPDMVTLYIISECKNTSNEVYYPREHFTIQPFQDRLGMEQATYISGSSRDTEWGEAYSPDVEVQPGESTVYFVSYKLSTNSEIEVDVTTSSMYEEEQSQSYTVECDESVASKLSGPEEIEFDAESESLLHIESKDGTYDLLGYMFDSSNNNYIIYVFSRYENTGESTNYLNNAFRIRAFQDGVSMEAGYAYYFDSTGTEWEKARSSSTSVKPGASVICYTSFQLFSDSEIELDVTSYDMYELTEEERSYMIECDKSIASGLGSAVDEDAAMDSLLHVENEYGTYDLVGCYYVTNNFMNEETEIFYVFTRFENTSEDTINAQISNRISAYQDGEELNSSSIYISLNDTEWAKARSAGTYVKPGASMIYYVAFAPSGDSDIEVRYSDSLGEALGSYTFQYGEW